MMDGSCGSVSQSFFFLSFRFSVCAVCAALHCTALRRLCCCCLSLQLHCCFSVRFSAPPSTPLPLVHRAAAAATGRVRHWSPTADPTPRRPRPCRCSPRSSRSMRVRARTDRREGMQCQSVHSARGCSSAVRLTAAVRPPAVAAAAADPKLNDEFRIRTFGGAISKDTQRRASRTHPRPCSGAI